MPDFPGTPGQRVAPSLLAADFARLEQAVRVVESAGASVLHLDVMDGHFVPNISFGVPVIASLRKTTNLYFDTHLMISEPRRYAEAFAKAGSDLISFHIETESDAPGLVHEIRELGVSVGVVLNPTTPVSAIDSILHEVDLVLVMSVWPGFGGQSFMAEVLPKVRELRTRLGRHQRLEIDGGIDARTIGSAAQAGADTFVAGTAVFGAANPGTAFNELEQLARTAAYRGDESMPAG
jgi:ribulose-phosphate 3-epimerase